ncbi:MAG: hypothetical protein GF307_04035 [candidate division Zixibacteria bacterium]|nr:hypothetical protein [candidate division Zixibacteria bacterium]
MNQKSVNVKRWLGALLLAAAGAMTIYMAVSTNSEISKLNDSGLAQQENFAATVDRLNKVTELLNKIPNTEHKHILATSKDEKESFTKELTSNQNELLNQIHELERLLDEENREYLYNAKEAIAFFATNSMQVQEYSYKGYKNRAWELSQKESIPSIDKAMASIDTLRENITEANFANQEELEERANALKAAAYNKLYLVLFFIAAAFILFLAASLKRLTQSSADSKTSVQERFQKQQTSDFSQVVGEPKKMSEQKSEPEPERASNQTEQQDSVNEEINDFNTTENQTVLDEVSTGMNENSFSANDVEAKIKEREGAKNQIDGLLNQAAELSGKTDSGASTNINDFGKVFDNSLQVTQMLKSVSDMSTSSVAESQEIAIRVAKIGEYEVRKLASCALKVAREIQGLMLNNYNKIIASIQAAQKVGQELQGTIGNVKQVSEVLEQAKGADNIIQSLETYMKDNQSAPAGIPSIEAPTVSQPTVQPTQQQQAPPAQQPAAQPEQQQKTGPQESSGGPLDSILESDPPAAIEDSQEQTGEQELQQETSQQQAETENTGETEPQTQQTEEQGSGDEGEDDDDFLDSLTEGPRESQDKPEEQTVEELTDSDIEEALNTSLEDDDDSDEDESGDPLSDIEESINKQTDENLLNQESNAKASKNKKEAESVAN